MKHYAVKILTQSGVTTLIHSEEDSLFKLEHDTKSKFGTFITMSVDEFEDPSIDEISYLNEGQSVDIKPFGLVTYTVYKIKHHAELEIDCTADGWKKAKCTMHEFMLAIRANSFNSLKFQ